MEHRSLAYVSNDVEAGRAGPRAWVSRIAGSGCCERPTWADSVEKGVAKLVGTFGCGATICLKPLSDWASECAWQACGGSERWLRG